MKTTAGRNDYGVWEPSFVSAPIVRDMREYVPSEEELEASQAQAQAKHLHDVEHEFFTELIDLFEEQEASQAKYQRERGYESTEYRDKMDDDEYANVNCNEI